MDTKNENKDSLDVETITAYAQLAYRTLQHSGTDITAKSVKLEVKMLYEKFGNQGVKRLAKIIKDNK